ncbi:MAG: hypothetical protein KC462_08135 [Cyanobacteria bacterium HKST-UBA05]|nr:hypothetical protein [Cyanobacteria bacterium HKST-UBA05]
MTAPAKTGTILVTLPSRATETAASQGTPPPGNRQDPGQRVQPNYTHLSGQHR